MKEMVLNKVDGLTPTPTQPRQGSEVELSSEFEALRTLPPLLQETIIGRKVREILDRPLPVGTNQFPPAPILALQQIDFQKPVVQDVLAAQPWAYLEIKDPYSNERFERLKQQWSFFELGQFDDLPKGIHPEITATVSFCYEPDHTPYRALIPLTGYTITFFWLDLSEKRLKDGYFMIDVAPREHRLSNDVLSFLSMGASVAHCLGEDFPCKVTGNVAELERRGLAANSSIVLDRSAGKDVTQAFFQRANEKRVQLAQELDARGELHTYDSDPKLT